MVTRPRATPRELTPEDIAEIQQQMEIQQEDDDSPEDIAYVNLRSELGIEGDLIDARVFVSRLNNGDDGYEARVWNGSPEDFDLTRIAKKFGSGQYRIKLYAKGEKGYRVMRGQKVEGILLEAERKDMQSMTVSTPSVSLEDVRRTVIETMTMMQPKQPEPINPMAMMMQLSEVMRNLMPMQQPVAQVDQFGMFQKALELVKSLQSDVEPIERGANATTSDVMLGLLNKFGGPIAQALQQSQQTQPQLPMPRHQMPMPQPNPINMQPASPSEDDMNLKLKMGLNLLITACDSGGSPQTYAELALDQVPEAEITQILSLPDPIAVLVQFDPRVGDEKHRPWFTEVFNEIRELMKPDSEEQTS